LLPDTPENRRLAEWVAPPDWKNPVPARKYHLVVLGGGTAGLICAIGAAGLGARVALVESGLLGGDCLNVGCVPSKALLRSARGVASVRGAPDVGIDLPGPPVPDFPRVMQRLRALRASIAPHDSASRYKGLGVDVFLGRGRFLSPRELVVDPQPGAGPQVRLSFHRAVIATGGRPHIPNLPGLAAAQPLTNETVFSLETLPPRLAVMGAGPVGCELAQALARLGSRVTLVANHSQVLPREPIDAARLVEASLRRDGIDLRLGVVPLRVEPASGAAWPGDGMPGDRVPSNAGARAIRGHTLIVAGGAGEERIDCDQILIAAGRVPNVEGLGLEQAGVASDLHRGVLVDDFLRTANRRIYAAGDVCSPQRFTHAADAMARIVIRNALFWGRQRFSRLVIPWCTYTSPEVAGVGLTAEAARLAGVAIDTYRHELSQTDRAVLEGATEGYFEVHVRRGTDQIVGGTVVGEHAGEWLTPLTTALTTGRGLRTLSGVITPYPTVSAAWGRLGDACNRARLTPTVARLLRGWLRLWG
jgi:pyruvate/2-oxoglutarate dehydrogenase complex dihydrolipoamide dehydrogenase (E3) component